MIIYLSLFFICIVMGYCEIYINSFKYSSRHYNTRTVSFCIIFILLLFLGILRAPDLGYDTNIYFKDYYRMSDKPIDFIFTREDPFFYLLMRGIRKIYDNYTFVRSVIYALTLILYSVYIKKNSENYGFSFALYIAFQFIGFDFGILRQALAVSFMACAWDSIRKRKYVRFVIMSIIACVNHKTAIFAVVLFIILNLPTKYLRYCEILFLPLILTLSKVFLLNAISEYQDGIYLTDTNKNAGYMQILIYISLIVLLFTIFILFEKKIPGIYMDFLIWCLIIQIAALNLSVFARMNTYLWAIMTAEFTIIDLKNKNKLLFQEINIFIFFIIFLYSLIKNAQLIVPYRFFN